MFAGGLVVFLNSHAHLIALSVGVFGCAIILGMLGVHRTSNRQGLRPLIKKRKSIRNQRELAS
jgi:hypothetical protein